MNQERVSAARAGTSYRTFPISKAKSCGSALKTAENARRAVNELWSALAEFDGDDVPAKDRPALLEGLTTLEEAVKVSVKHLRAAAALPEYKAKK